MRLWVLGSGSRGNAVLLECAGARVLVDAGFPARVLAARLEQIGVAPESIEAAVVTHEHIDHVRGAAAAARRWSWTLHASTGTADACPELKDADVRTFESGATVSLSTMDLHTVSTPHDAAEPVAVVATARGTGVRCGIAYDLGSVPRSVSSAFRDLDLLVLEANHDDEMLHTGPYPASVRARVAGSHGHLSNDAAGAMARNCAHAALNHVVLAHLSQTNNRPELAAGAVSRALAGTRFRGRVHTASQDLVAGPFEPRAGRAKAAIQLGLGI